MNILLWSLFLLLFLSSTSHGMQEPARKCHHSPIKIFSDNDDEDPTCEDMIKTCAPCIVSALVGKICFPNDETVPCLLSFVTFCATVYFNNQQRATDAILKRKMD